MRIIGLPVDVQRRAAEHIDALRREFELIRHSDGTGSLPARLLALIDELEGRFEDFTVEARTRLANAESHTVVDLDYHLPAEAVEAARDLLSLLDEADSFCRAGGHLVTLESSGEGKQFRTWFLGEFIRQGDGAKPMSWSEFVDTNGTAEDAEVEPAIPAATTSFPANDRWPTSVDGRTATVKLQGDIDIEESPGLRDHFNALITRGVNNITIDCERVTFIDSVGLSVLVSIYRHWDDGAGSVTIVNPSSAAARTLQISGLDEIFGLRS